MTDKDCVIDASTKIYSLFSCLDTQTYDKVALEIEYWIELVLTQQLTTVDNLVEGVSALAWTTYCCPASFARFLKEFRDSPHRSAQARSFVDEFCARVFRWFAAASMEDLAMAWQEGMVANGGGYGFVNAASFIGHLICCDLLDHNLVQLHPIRSLTIHHYPRLITPAETVRTNAIYRLFVVAGSTLVQGLLKPKDVQICFETLGRESSRLGRIDRLSTARTLKSQSSMLNGRYRLSTAKLEVRFAAHLNGPRRNPLTRGPGTSRAPCHVVAAE